MERTAAGAVGAAFLAVVVVDSDVGNAEAAVETAGPVEGSAVPGSLDIEVPAGAGIALAQTDPAACAVQILAVEQSLLAGLPGHASWQPRLPRETSLCVPMGPCAAAAVVAGPEWWSWMGRFPKDRHLHGDHPEMTGPCTSHIHFLLAAAVAGSAAAAAAVEQRKRQTRSAQFWWLAVGEYRESAPRG